MTDADETLDFAFKLAHHIAAMSGSRQEAHVVSVITVLLNGQSEETIARVFATVRADLAEWAKRG